MPSALIQQSQRPIRNQKASKLKCRFQICSDRPRTITSIKPIRLWQSAHSSDVQSIQRRLSPRVIFDGPRIANDRSTTLHDHRLPGRPPLNLEKSGVTIRGSAMSTLKGQLKFRKLDRRDYKHTGSVN
jgi:hypothetical protein